MDAVIFDMDGVISDTQRLHSEVESNLLRGWGIQIGPDDLTRRYAGSPTATFFPRCWAGP